MRVVLEILKQTRREVGNDFVIGARMNGDDFVLGGTTLKQSTVIASRLAEEGVDYISVSCGGGLKMQFLNRGNRLIVTAVIVGSGAGPVGICLMRQTFTFAEAIKKEIMRAGLQTPVITSGKIPYPALGEEILQGGKADLIGLADLLCDPEWPKKTSEGREEEIVRCIYCDHCSNCDRNFQPVVCSQWPKGSFNAPIEWTPKTLRFTSPIQGEDE